MIVINTHAKVGSHMAQVHINDIPLAMQIMLIGICSAKLMLNGANAMHFSNGHNVVSNLIYRR